MDKWCRRTLISLIQVMACRLFATKPLSVPMLINPIFHKGAKSSFFIKKMYLKMLAANGSQFVPISMGQNISWLIQIHAHQDCINIVHDIFSEIYSNKDIWMSQNCHSMLVQGVLFVMNQHSSIGTIPINQEQVAYITNAFSITIQILWAFVSLLFWSWLGYYYKYLRMPWQHSCRIMCRYLQWNF